MAAVLNEAHFKLNVKLHLYIGAYFLIFCNKNKKKTRTIQSAVLFI